MVCVLLIVQTPVYSKTDPSMHCILRIFYVLYLIIGILIYRNNTTASQFTVFKKMQFYVSYSST